MKTFTRGLDLLTAFADRPRCRFDDLAAATHIPRSSLYRFIAALESRGFLCQDKATKEYLPGPLLYRLGIHGNGLSHLKQAVRSEMPKVVERIGESAYLYAREGIYRVCLEVVETHRESIKHFINAGSRFPLSAGASGKAILAFLPDADRLQVLKATPLKKLGPKTFVDRRELQQELERIRAQGYAYSEEELSAGAWSLAVPLFGESKECVASLAVAGPLFRLDRARVPDYVRLLRGLAGNIHKTLQGEALSNDRGERGDRHGRHSR